MPIAEKLCLAMNVVGYLKKDRKLEGGARYNYLSEEKVTAEVHAAFADIGICIVPICMEILENREDTTLAGNAVHVTRIRVTYQLMDAQDGSTLTLQSLGEGSDSGDKCLNKCMTAAYKYALRESLIISTGDDPDAVPIVEDAKSTQKPVSGALRGAGASSTPNPANTPAAHDQRIVAAFDKQAMKLGFADMRSYCAGRGVDFDLVMKDQLAQPTIIATMKSEFEASVRDGGTI